MLAVCTAWLFPGDAVEPGSFAGISNESDVSEEDSELRGVAPECRETPARQLFRCARWATTRSVPDSRRRSGASRVSGRKIELRWVHKEQELDGCEVIFFSRSEEKRYGKILQGLKGKSVLTIGESEGFLEAGGMVELSFEKDRLQMEVNLAAARNANLKVDARLLAMAKQVVTEHSAPGG